MNGPNRPIFAARPIEIEENAAEIARTAIITSWAAPVGDAVGSYRIDVFCSIVLCPTMVCPTMV
jgi:hypothetical protein